MISDTELNKSFSLQWFKIAIKNGNGAATGQEDKLS